MKHLYLSLLAFVLSFSCYAQVVGPINGPLAICAGTTTTLTDTSAGGVWSSGSGIISVDGSGNVTGLVVGTAGITYTTGSGSSTAIVTVNAIPSPITGTLAACVGSTIALTDASGGGTWSSSNTAIATIGSSSGITTGIVAGTAMITYTSPTGCLNTAVVTMNPMPPAIMGASFACVGSTSVITDAMAGGFWSSSNPAVGTITSAGVIFTSAPGTTTISYTLPTGCFTTMGVTINPAPPAILGTPVVCAGGTTTLSDLVPGGTWASSNATVAVIGFSTGLLTGTAIGTAFVTYTLPSGCSTSVVVTVNPGSSPISGASGVCIGSTTTLTDATTGGTWSSATLLVGSVSATGTFTGISAGTTTISYSLPSGCIIVQVMTVSPLPGPIGGSLSLCLGAGDTLTNAAFGGTWSSTDPSVATIYSTGQVFTGSAGATTISYVMPGGCYVTAGLTVSVTVAPITGTLSTCAGGGTTALSDATPGGIWSSSNPSVGTVAAGTGVVTGNMSGITTITYTIIATGCRNTASILVSVCPCAGTPDTGVATVNTTSLCYGHPVALNLVGVVMLSGISYQWQTSPDGATWGNLTGATTPYYSYNPPVSQYYRCMQTCIASGLSAYSSPAYVNVTIGISTHSVIPSSDTVCSDAHFYISTCAISSSDTVVTFFGDGTSSSTPLITSTISYAHVYHAYASSGAYLVKQVLYNAGVAVDSVTFSYTYSYCRTFAVKLFYDGNGDCLLDGSESYNAVPMNVEIDSSGIAIDTVSVTSGLYYRAVGPYGTVYGFRVLSTASGMTVGCPAAGIVYDTLSAAAAYPVRYFALTCGSSSFDLTLTASQTNGRHMQQTSIVVYNSLCTSVMPVVTMVSSPKYSSIISYDTHPMPTTVAGNIITWNLPLLGPGASATVHLHMERPGGSAAWLIPGDTIMTHFTVTPMDVDSANNMVALCNTVNASYDPNNMAVSPVGYVLPCTKLEYTVMFENTGNDTAHNIHIMDTLSDDFDPHTLSIVAASATMNTSIYNEGGHNIVKFDFPQINLLDTTHHTADGVVVFNIKTKSSLADGAIIANEAGIYFDDNPVVMTNAVQNTIGMSSITGIGSVCAGMFDTLVNSTAGGLWTASNGNASVTGGAVVAILPGLDTISYTVSNSCTSRSATKVVTINSIPVTGTISGTPTVCPAATTTLSDAFSGGVWSSDATGTAIVVAGVVTGIAAGTANITYIAGNACGADTTSIVVTVNPLPVAGTISGSTAICIGSLTTLTATGTGGVWSSGAGGIASVGSTGVVNGVSSGVVTISYAVTNSCGTDYTTQVETVNATVVPAVAISAAPGDTLCAGNADIFIAAPTNGGVSPFYQWKVNGIDVITGITYSYVPVNGDVVTVVMASHANCATPDTVIHTVTIVAETPLIPVVTINANPGLAISAGEVDTLTAVAGSAGSSPSYQWVVNGTIIPGATNAVYYSTFNNHDSVSCRVTSNGMCAGFTSYNSVYINVNTGVGQIPLHTQLVLYPNPTSSELNIAWENYAAGNADVAITDISGRDVYRSAISITAGSGRAHLDLPDMVDGIYLVTIKAANGDITHSKLEIKK